MSIIVVKSFFCTYWLDFNIYLFSQVGAFSLYFPQGLFHVDYFFFFSSPLGRLGKLKDTEG